MTYRKSDYPIVVWKQGNACGAKGITLLCKGEVRHIKTAEWEKMWKLN